MKVKDAQTPGGSFAVASNTHDVRVTGSARIFQHGQIGIEAKQHLDQIAQVACGSGMVELGLQRHHAVVDMKASRESNITETSAVIDEMTRGNTTASSSFTVVVKAGILPPCQRAPKLNLLQVERDACPV